MGGDYNPYSGHHNSCLCYGCAITQVIACRHQAASLPGYYWPHNGHSRSCGCESCVPMRSERDCHLAIEQWRSREATRYSPDRACHFHIGQDTLAFMSNCESIIMDTLSLPNQQRATGTPRLGLLFNGRDPGI